MDAGNDTCVLRLDLGLSLLSWKQCVVLFIGKEKDPRKKSRTKKLRDLNEKGMKKEGSDMDAFTDPKVGLTAGHTHNTSVLYVPYVKLSVRDLFLCSWHPSEFSL